jgi:hypothetical protein
MRAAQAARIIFAPKQRRHAMTVDLPAHDAV